MNLMDLALFIDRAMREWILLNPNNKSQEDCEAAVLKGVMQYTRGHYNPEIMKAIVKLHTEPMEEFGYLLTL